MKPLTGPRPTVLESLAIRIDRYRRDSCMLQHFQEEKGFEERRIILRGPTSRERYSWNSSPGLLSPDPQFLIGYPLPSDCSETHKPHC